MIPIRDENPSSTRPWITWVLILITAAVYFFVQPSDTDDGSAYLFETATVPCEVMTGEPLTLEEIRQGVCESGRGDPVFPTKSIAFSLLASLFLHGSIPHLIGNLWVLYIFGNNIEDRMRHFRYLAFYLVAGFIASLTHILRYPNSTLPVVGASGAIAGVMGAYLVLFPRARVVSIIAPFFFWPFRVPAVLFLGLWFLTQFSLSGQATTIAWEAHVGGFLFGLVYATIRRRRFLRY